MDSEIAQTALGNCGVPAAHVPLGVLTVVATPVLPQRTWRSGALIGAG